MVTSVRAKLCAYWAGDECPPIDPLYGLYMAGIGLKPLQIAQLFALWWAIKLVAEIPAGILADRYPVRKHLLAIAQVLRIGCFALWLYQPTFDGFAIGFVLRGIGGSLISGTYQALLYEQLVATGQANHYTRAMGQTESWGFVARICGKLAAVTSMMLWNDHGYQVTLWISIAAATGTALIALWLPTQPRRVYTATTAKAIRKTAQQHVLHSFAVRYSIAFAAIVGGLFAVIDEFRGLIVQSLGVPVAVIPLILLVIDIPVTFGTRHTYRLRAQSDWRFVAIFMGLGFVLLAGGLFGTVLSGLSLSVSALVTRCLGIVYDAKLQHALKPATRATVASVKGLVTMIVTIALFWTCSRIVDQINSTMLVRFAAIVLVAAATLGLMTWKQPHQ